MFDKFAGMKTAQLMEDFSERNAVELTPYLQTETKGEAELTVDLGTHTFLKVKAETVIKNEGDVE